MLPRLKADFGVTALIAIIIIVASFLMIAYGMYRGMFDGRELLAVVSSWVSSVVTAFVVAKGIKMSRGG